ncbi:MAG: hypothetical protein DRQ55_17630, partial [Planctomycetota bacterium]
MTITEAGQVVRTRAAEISSMGRATNGVRVISVKKDDRLASIARVPPDEPGDDEDGEGDDGGGALQADGSPTPAPQGATSGDEAPGDEATDPNDAAPDADDSSPPGDTPRSDPPEGS